jgi:hypothetical protein
MDGDEMDKLLARQGEVQERLDALDAWELDSRLEIAYRETGRGTRYALSRIVVAATHSSSNCVPGTSLAPSASGYHGRRVP